MRSIKSILGDMHANVLLRIEFVAREVVVETGGAMCLLKRLFGGHCEPAGGDEERVDR